MRVVSALEQALAGTRLYRPAQRLHHRLFRRDRLGEERTRREFFSQFVARDSLVFDIGANDGRYTVIYLDLGARVVAVEPNPALVEYLRGHFPLATVEPVGVAAAEGTAELNVSDIAILSSMATDWMQRARRVYGEDRWSGEAITVPVTTLDHLIDRHGHPDYVKIDVEGFESEVLRGLSHPIRQVSFEVQSWAPELARECLQLLEKLGRYEFNISISDELKLWPNWMQAEELLAVLDAEGQRRGATHADVFARSA